MKRSKLVQTVRKEIQLLQADFSKEKHIGTESIKEERDYKAEYKKYSSSTKSKKYRAELTQYNRKRGTYGNKDGMDASHKGGKIVGFEKESINRGRKEKSRLKKEAILKLRQMIREEIQLLIEAQKFKASKMEKLLDKDRFLQRQYDKLMKPGKFDDETVLEILFDKYVIGDTTMERKYNRS